MRGLWTVVALVGASLVAAAGCSEDEGGGEGGAVATTTTTTSDTTSTSTSTGTGGPGSCPDFTLTVLEWSWDWYNESTGVYTFSTLLQACGPLDCYSFAGVDDHDKLVFNWDEGETIDIYRTAGVDLGSGFGVRMCLSGCCEIGDVFQSNFVYSTFSDNDRLQQLVTSYGPPDEACGHVFNAELVEEVYCAPLDGGAGGGGGSSGGAGGAGGNSGGAGGNSGGAGGQGGS
jgi:hypothetical protein